LQAWWSKNALLKTIDVFGLPQASLHLYSTLALLEQSVYLAYFVYLAEYVMLITKQFRLSRCLDRFFSLISSISLITSC